MRDSHKQEIYIFLIIAGGKESRTYGIDLNSGRIIYECTLHGCTRDPKQPEDDMEDVLVVQVIILMDFLLEIYSNDPNIQKNLNTGYVFEWHSNGKGMLTSDTELMARNLSNRLKTE